MCTTVVYWSWPVTWLFLLNHGPCYRLIEIKVFQLQIYDFSPIYPQCYKYEFV